MERNELRSALGGGFAQTRRTAETEAYTSSFAQAQQVIQRRQIFDLQQEFLDHTMRRAAERGLENIVPTHGDATALSYEDASIDAVVLNAVIDRAECPISECLDFRSVRGHRPRLQGPYRIIPLALCLE